MTCINLLAECSQLLSVDGQVISIVYLKTVKLETHCKCRGTASIAQLVECPLRGTGGHGFDPGPRHTKVVKNGTSCSALGTQTYGLELGLVDPASG